MDLFDLFDGVDTPEEVLPFYKVVKKNKEERLMWLNQTKDALIEQSRRRTGRQREYLAAYRGISSNPYDRRKEYNNVRRMNRINKFVIPHIHDLTETRISQLNRLKPNVQIIPANQEWTDRAGAKVTDLLIKHLWYINNVDDLFQRLHRYKAIFGEAYVFVLWDENKGDLNPLWVEARDRGLKEIKLDGNKAFELDKPIYNGDIKYELEVPWRVLLQRKDCFEDVEYVIRMSVVPTEELKDDYPKAAKDIEETNDLHVYDMENLENRFLEKHTVIYEFYHKYTSKLGKGRYVKFTENVILEDSDLPFSHGKLPMIRLTDIDVPEVLNGVSKYEMVLPMQNMYNNINTLIAKNIYLTAHAKWMMPRGACKIEQLGNDNTVVQYQGPVAPQLAQVAPNAPEVYAYMESIKGHMQTIYGSHGISRGEVPKGITATSALQFLNELESERAATDISKHATTIRDLARMTIAVCGDYYEVSDGRMLRIVGKDNQYLVRHFDSANLNKDYDIRVDNSSGLPETKSAKMQRVFDALQRHPTLFSAERWEELLELGNAERMIKLSTEAVKAADSENEDLLAGEPVELPEEWEDHLAHWEAHTRAMQSRSYKEESPNEIHDAVKEHVYWTEKLMIQKSKTNPLFQSKLAQLKLFPIFYHEEFVTPMSAEHNAAVVQGAANKEGKSVTGAIPGTDIEEIREQQKK